VAVTKQQKSWLPVGVVSAGVGLVLAVAPIAMATTGTEGDSGGTAAVDQNTSSGATAGTKADATGSAGAPTGTAGAATASTGDKTDTAADTDDTSGGVGEDDDTDSATEPSTGGTASEAAAASATVGATETAAPTETATETETETATETASPTTEAAAEAETGVVVETGAGVAPEARTDPSATQSAEVAASPTASAEPEAAAADDTSADEKTETSAPTAELVAETVAALAATAEQSDTDAAEAAPAAATLVMTAATSDLTSVASSPNLVSLLGSLVFGMWTAVLRLFEGFPSLPAGSTVNVRQSSLTIDVAGGTTVPAYWYFPADANPDRLIVLQHGFLASAPMYSYTAATLAQNTHSIVVTLSLSSNFLDADGAWIGGDALQRAFAKLLEGNRTELTRSATAAAGHTVVLPTEFVLAGHSAGGGFALGVANHLDAAAMSNLAGILMFDGVAMGTVTATELISSLPADLPIMQIAGLSYGWNLYGDTTLALSQARPGQFNGVELSWGRHMDSMQSGNAFVGIFVLSLLEFSLPQNVDAIQSLASTYVNKMFTGATDYGTPGQTFTISTAHGTATALPLPGSAGSLWILDALLKSAYLFVIRLAQELALGTESSVATSV